MSHSLGGIAAWKRVRTLDREAGRGVAGRSVSVTLSALKCSLSAVFFERRGCCGTSFLRARVEAAVEGMVERRD